MSSALSSHHFVAKWRKITASSLASAQSHFILFGSDVMHNEQRPCGWTVQRDLYWLEASIPGVFVAGDVHH